MANYIRCRPAFIIVDRCGGILRFSTTRLAQEGWAEGFVIGARVHRVSALQGFARQEYNSEIRRMLGQTEFKGGYQMALAGIWIRVTLKNGQ